MLNSEQILGSIEDLSFCAECHRELDKQRGSYIQCYTCDELLCPKCSRCACDRVSSNTD